MGDILFGESPSVDMMNTMTPEQQKLLAGLSSSLMGSIFKTPDTGVTPTSGATPQPSGITPDMSNFNIGNIDSMGPMDSGPGLGNTNPMNLTPYAAPAAAVPTELAGAPVYPGDMTAGPSAIQQQLFDKIPGLLGGTKSGNAAMDAFLSKYKGGYNAQAFDPTSTLNMFNSSVYDPAMKGFKEDTLPQIAELFAGRGSFDSGGTMHEMTGAASDLASNLAGTKASMLDSSKKNWDNMELNKFLNINSLIPGMATAATNNSLAGLPLGLEAGAEQQALGQTDVNQEISKWSEGQPYNNPYLKLLQMVLGTNAITPVVEGGSTGFLDSLMGGAGYAGGAKLMSLMAS